MTMSDTTAAPARHFWLRVALAVVAAYELWDAIANVPAIFADEEPVTGYARFAQGLISFKLALAPLVAGTALVFAAWGQLSRAILALAALALLTWLLDDLWSIPVNGFELEATLGGAAAFARHIAFPIAAILAIVLVRQARLPGLAALLVSLPTLVKWLGIILFQIAMAMYS